jgi:CubicO group peptidase (beta-lactamase class C family)
MIVERILRPGFEPLRDLFASHFERDDEFRELGAALAVYEAGEKVVDLHGGYLDPARSRRWTDHTLTNIWSASKGVMAVAIAQLVDAGLLDYEAPVARWWPEFAQRGKGDITLDQVMSHRTGLNGFDEATEPGDLYDWDLIASRLARQAPLWRPGSTAAYHGMTYGALTGEIVRRVSGLMPREYIRQHIAAPLGADLWLGAPRDRMDDVADIIPPLPDTKQIVLNPIASRCVVNPAPNAAAANHAAWRAAQLPAVNIHASADGLARFYGALANGGRLDGTTLVSERGLTAMVRPRGAPHDEMLGVRQWAAGVALNLGGLYGHRPDAFGHSGWGGSFGCADPGSRRGIAYIANRMGSALNGDPRARALVTLATSIHSR